MRWLVLAALLGSVQSASAVDVLTSRYTNDPEWGILSTPVIDPSKSIVYVVAWHDGSDRGELRARGPDRAPRSRRRGTSLNRLE